MANHPLPCQNSLSRDFLSFFIKKYNFNKLKLDLTSLPTASVGGRFQTENSCWD